MIWWPPEGSSKTVVLDIEVPTSVSLEMGTMFERGDMNQVHV